MNVTSLSARDNARAVRRLGLLGLAAALLLGLPAAAQAQTLTIGQPATVVGEAATTLVPGGPKVALDHFQLTSSATSSVTSLTVTFPAGSAALLGRVTIENSAACNQATPFGTLATVTADVSVVPTAGLSATTAALPLWVCITPKTHAAMGAVPGTSVAVTGRVTAATVAAGTVAATADVVSLARTIDNTSPAAPTAFTAVAGDATVSLNWTNPAADFFEVMVLMKAGSAVTDAPVEGVEYFPYGYNSTTPTVLGTSTVIYNGSATAFAATGLLNTPATNYYFRIFARDAAGNWSATGPAIGPFTPSTTSATTIGPGTEAGNASLAPGGALTSLDAFTLTTGGTTNDTLTGLTVTLTPANAYSVIGSVVLTNDATTTTYATVTNPTSNTVSFTGLAINIVAGTPAQYRIRITPRAHAAMPAVPGASYGVQAVVSAITVSKAKAGQDSNASSVVTIDNLSPVNGAWGTTTPASGQVTLNWTNPVVADFASSVILRSSAPISDAPAEGSTLAAGAAVGSSVVAFAGAGVTATVTGLTNGTPYYFKLFARDTNGNYASGSQIGPLIPGTGTTIGSTVENTLLPVVQIVNPAGGARVSPSTTGFKVQIRAYSPPNGALPATNITGLVLRQNGVAVVPAPVKNAKYGAAATSGIWEATLNPAAGTYTFDAQATNGAGTVTSNSISVTVQAAAVKGDGNLLVRDNASSLCTDCHAIATHSAESVSSTYGSWSTYCRDCHVPHGSTNAYLVSESITPPPRGATTTTPKTVAFSGPGATGTGNATTARTAASYVNTDNTGPCQVCHTLTKYYRADGSSPGGLGHQTGNRCTDCHGHVAGMAVNCTQCHGTVGRVAAVAGADPRLASAPPVGTAGETLTSQRAVGAHQAHLNQATYTDAPLACSDCHPASTNHNGIRDMAWSPLASGVTAAVPLTPTFNGTSCSSTWCHGAGLKAGATITPPIWTGGPSQAACGTCHASPPPAPHPGAPSGCGVCHTGYETTGLTAAAKLTHIDGLLQVPSLTSCTACHGTPGRLPVAGLAGVDATRIPYAPPLNAAGSAAAEAHLAHINERSVPVSCEDCHPVMPFPGDPSHPDGTRVISLSQSALGNSGGAIATYSGYPGGTCTSYCHGSTFDASTKGSNTTPTWASVLDCGSCHGAPPADPRHRSVTATLPLTQCVKCHNQTVNAAGAIVVAAGLHVNGIVETNIQALECSGCHGNLARTDNNGIAATWFQSAPPTDTVGGSATTAVSVGVHQVHVFGTRSANVACDECHYGSSAFDVAGLNPATMWLHADGIVDVKFGPPALGFIAQQGLTATTANYVRNSATSATCSSTYCHGPSAPSWTAAGTITNCNTCHGTNPAAATATPPALPHPANATCGNCHTGYTNTTIPSFLPAASTHLDGHPDTASVGCTSCHGTIASAGASSGTPALAAPGVSPTSYDIAGTTPVAVTTPTYGAHAAHVLGSSLLTAAPLTSVALACDSCHTVPADGNTAHGTGTGTGGANATIVWSPLATGTVAALGPVGTPSATGGATTAAARVKAAVDAAAAAGPGTTIGTDAWSTPAVPSYARPGGCATTYCHGQFTNGQLGKTVVWTQDITLTCNSCHGGTAANANQANPAIPPGGTHPASATCSSCHAGYTNTTVNRETHINGKLEVTSGTSCNGCHGTAGRVAVAGTFGATESANNLLAVPPVATTAVNDTVRIGMHLSHASPALPSAQMFRPVLCSECHGTAVNTYGLGHTDSALQLTFANSVTANLGGVTAAIVQGTPPVADTCTTYCHGASLAAAAKGSVTTWSWNSTATAAGCGTCHASPPADQFHTRLTKPSAATACNACHASVVNATGGIVFTGTGPTATSLHINGLQESSSATCTSCHGTAGVNNAPPTTSTGVTTGVKVGAHQKHLTGTALRAAAIACADCHVVPTAMDHASGGLSVVTWSALTTTGGLVVTPAAGAITAAWETTPTCTNYCHGQKWAADATKRGTVTAPSWTGAATQVACGTCHLSPPTNASHSAVYPSTTKNCQDCHAGYNCLTGNLATCTINKAGHINGTVEVTGQTCSSCHGTAGRVAATGTFGASNSTNNIIAAPPTAAASTDTTVRIGMHLSHSVPATPAQQMYKPILCSECHGTGVNTYTTSHGDGTTQLTFANATGASLNGFVPSIAQAAPPAADTCTTYCHGGQLTAAQKGTVTTWSWNSTATAAGCGTCHGSAPNDPVHTSVSKTAAATACNACHASVVNATGGIVFTGTGAAATTLHINGVREASTATCYSCHGTLAAGNAAPPIATNGNTLTTQVKVGAHQAHLTTPTLRAANIACTDCHVVPTAMNHATGSANLTWSAFVSTGGVAVTPAAGALPVGWETTPTCTNYCHGGKWAANATYSGTLLNPSWTAGAAGAACGTCHKAPPTSSSHAAVTTTKNCNNCHAGYNCTSGNLAACTVNLTTHINGTHDAEVMTCASCHGSVTNFAPPTTTTGLATGVKVGAHQKHMVATNLRATALICDDCHTIPGANVHSDSILQFSWSTLATTGGLVPTPANLTAAQLTTWEATPTCTNYCHGQKWAANATYRGTVTAPNWTTTTVAMACNACHLAPPTSAGHSTVTATTNCSTCHTGYSCTSGNLAACTVNKTTHINGTAESSGDCISCHTGTQGTRRAIVPEFALAWSHKRSAAGAVTKFDCAVCHMEGNLTTGDVVPAYHPSTAGGAINLRDPDTGLEITNVSFTAATATTSGSYAAAAGNPVITQFSRNLASATLEPAVQAIMINQCLKCHDSNGATNAFVPGGSAAKPFATTIAGATYTGAGVTAAGTLGGVTDVNASFATTNASYHPIRGKQNNSFVGNLRMNAPWNTLTPAKVPGTIGTVNTWGFLISCWDCHAPTGTASTVTLTSTVTAHGGASTLRQANWVVNATNICTVCHNVVPAVGATTNSHGVGSAFSGGGNSGPGGIARTSCWRCHGSLNTGKPARPYSAQDAHGFDAFSPAMGTDTLWPVGATNTYRPYGFMRSAGASGMWVTTSWKPLSGTGVPTGSATCGGTAALGAGCSSNGHNAYTPGGVY